MHLRFIITDMCLDVEHAMTVQMIKDIENDTTTDGYDIVYDLILRRIYHRIISQQLKTAISMQLRSRELRI